ncbi:MAG: penicillin-binding protein activator LpoB [Nitrospirae bacterium]|nr:penicillin-binding protein activator LpoB [Nitrospirota bacterium]
MQKLFKFFLLLLFLPAIACAPTTTVTKVDEPILSRSYNAGEYTGPKKKVAIAKFTNSTRFGQRRLGDTISNILATEFEKTNRFLLLERERMDKIFDELKLSMSGLTTGTLSQSQIQLIDADYIITGDVTHYSVNTAGSSDIFTKSKVQTAEVAVDLRIINVRTGEIILSETGRGKAEKKFSQVLGMGSEGSYDESLEMDAFRAAAVKVTENIVIFLDRLPWTCDVIKVSGKRLYIDAGRKSNLKIGDQIDLYKKGETIKDVSGRILGYEEVFLDRGRITDYVGEEAAIVEIVNIHNVPLPLIGKIKK